MMPNHTAPAGRSWRAGWLLRFPLILILSVCMLVSPASVAGAVVRSDIGGHWAQRDLQLLKARGVMEGFPDGTFRPEALVTRAQFTKMLIAALQHPLPSAAVPVGFQDVPGSHWARPYVNAAWEAGFVRNTGSLFSPDAPLPRSELAYLMDRALGSAQTVAAPSIWPDAQAIPGWARPAVDRLGRLGILKGFDDGTFRPDSFTTRAEAAVILVRLLGALGMDYDLFGTAESVSATHFTLVTQQDAREISVDLSADTLVWRHQRGTYGRGIEPLDEVAVLLDPAGRAVYVAAWSRELAATLVSINRTTGRVSFRIGEERLRHHWLAPGAPVFRNGRPTTVRDLRAGDEIFMLLSIFDGRIRMLDAVEVRAYGFLQGLQDGGGTMRIAPIGSRGTLFTIADDAIVMIDGYPRAIRLLRIGDRVYVAVDDQDRVIYVEAYRYERDGR